MKRFALTILFVFAIYVTGAWANKTTIEVKAPAEVKAGTEVTITLNVVHKGNSKTHHTDWVYLKINGKEVKRWSFEKESLPPGENFTVVFKYIADEPLTIEAEGHCNLHGSTGAKTTAIKTN